MWIGSEHYKSIEDWTKEAEEQGVSKRLPNHHVAKKLMEPGSMVFVAHDEGKTVECTACSRETDCPECRLASSKEARELAAAESYESLAEGKETSDPKAWASYLRRAKNARERAEAAAEDQAQCELCGGTARVKAGTGGHVLFGDGETWDYTTYNYWLHQPEKWKPEEKGEVSEDHMCETCGGKGKLPDGVVFGVFIPDRLEYIHAGDDKAAEELAGKGFSIVDAAALGREKPRKCGKRKPGGVYVVTTPSRKATKAATKLAKEIGLEASEFEVHGNFIRFLKPVAIPGVKRCRGLSRFELNEELAEEAEMIEDSLG